MGKPGSRTTDDKIIDKPDLKSPLRNLIEGSLTAFLWAVWVYWMIPLLTLVLWLFGVRMFYLSIFNHIHLSELREILFNGGFVIIIILTLNLLWINYNYYLIFKRLGNRRKAPQAYSEEKLAGYFSIDPAAVAEAKKKSRFEVTLEGKKLSIKSAS